MKKKLIRKVRIFFVASFCLFLLLSGLIYYAYQHSFELSPGLLQKIRSYSSENFNLDLNLAKATFNVKEHAIRVEKLELMIPGNEPFLQAQKVNLFLASGTGILDYYYARATVERVEMYDLTFDTRVERPRPQKDGKNPLAIIPVSEALVSGFNLQTETSCLTFPDFSAELIKGSKNATVKASVNKGPFGGKASLNAMSNLLNNDSSFRFSWQHDNLAFFTPLALVKHYYGLAINDGKVDIDLEWNGNLASRLEDPGENLVKLLNQELEGKLEIQTSNFAWAGFSGSAELRAQKNATAPWELTFKQKNDKSNLELDAQWLGNESSISEFKAAFSANRLQPQKKFFEFFAVDNADFVPGIISFKGNIGGNMQQLNGSGTLDATSWSVARVDLKQSDVHWRINDKNQLLQIETLIDANAGKIHASASLNLNGEKRVWVEGNVLDIDLARFQPLVDFPIAGKGAGIFKAQADLENLASAAYEMEVDLENTGLAAFKPEVVRGRVVGQGRNWWVEDPSADFADGGRIWLKGRVAPDELATRINIENVDLRQFAVPAHIVSGQASLQATLKGSFARPELYGEIWGSGLDIFKKPISSVKAQLKLKDDRLDLSPMVIIPENQGMIDGYYSFAIDTGETKSFKLNFQQLGLDFIRTFFPAEYSDDRLKGLVAGSVSYNNNKGENYWDFLLDGRGLRLYDQEIDSIYLEGSILGQQGEIRNLFLRAAGGKLHLTGQVLGLDRFDGSVEAESIRLEKINALTRILPGLRGQLDFQGGIEWEGPEKKGYFTLFGDKIMVKDRDLGNLGAEIIVDNAGLRVLKAEFDRLGVALEGNIDWAGLKPYEADLQMREVDLSFFTQAHGIKTFAYGGLIVDGQCSFSGNLASLTPDVVEMQLETIKIKKDNDVIVSNGPMQLKYQNNSLEIRSLELKYRQGILGVEGLLKPGQETALVFTGRDFSIKALGRLLDLPDWDYEGSLSANASVFGNYPELKLRADAEIKGFEIADRKIDGVNAKISGDTTQLTLEEFKVKLPTSSFEVKGKLKHENFLNLTGLDVDLSIPKGPISDLPVLLPGVFRQSIGTIAAELHLQGNPQHPQLSGELKLEADELGVSGMRKPFKDLRFAVSTQDSIINIDALEAKLGRGKILGEGAINFRDGPGSITAKISGEKIDLSFLNFELDRASASFRIGGNLYNPEIYGDVLVPRGKFHINTDLLKDRPGLNVFFNSLKYRINVEVPRNFWLKSSFLNAEMRGKFSVLGDLDNVNLDGGISSVQGWLIFQRRKFRIDTGEIRFGGVENKFDPHIFIKSEGQVQNTQVYLTLQGHISSMTPKIYSSPPMSEGDLLALLTLGRDMNSAMQSDSKDLFESEILDGLKNSYISALIGNTISTALNLDELFLTSLYDKADGRPRSFIRAGKYIGRNLFMAYEGTLDEREEETFIFEYRLPKGFVVNLEFEEPEKDKRIGVRYDWKFW